MEYHDTDRWLFQTRIKSKDHPPVWLLAAILIGWFLAMIYAASTGLDDVENIASDEQAAHEKKLALVSMPCSTWVCQKNFSHEPCGRSTNTACAPSADFTERK